MAITNVFTNLRSLSTTLGGTALGAGTAIATASSRLPAELVATTPPAMTAAGLGMIGVGAAMGRSGARAAAAAAAAGGGVGGAAAQAELAAARRLVAVGKTIAGVGALGLVGSVAGHQFLSKPAGQGAEQLTSSTGRAQKSEGPAAP